MSTNTNFTVYDPSKDNEFFRLYGVNESKATLEFSEGYLLKDGTSYMLCAYVESCDAIKKSKDWKWEFTKGLYSVQIETEGDKTNDFLKWLCSTIEGEIGVGKDKPFGSIISFNSLNDGTLKILSDAETILEVKAQLRTNALPVLVPLEKLDKLEGKEAPKFSKGKSASGGFNGGGVKSLSPSEKWDSVKPLLGFDTENLSQASKYISGMDAKQKEAFIALITAITQ